MRFQDAVTTCFRSYATFQGRARRAEYWYFILFNLLMHAATGLLDAAVFGPDGVGLINGLYGLAAFLPGLAVAVRRLHDVDRSGWWLLIAFIPLVGVIMLLVWACQDGSAGTNRFAPNPKLRPDQAYTT